MPLPTHNLSNLLFLVDSYGALIRLCFYDYKFHNLHTLEQILFYHINILKYQYS